MPDNQLSQRVELKISIAGTDYVGSMKAITQGTQDAGRTVQGLNKQLGDLRNTMTGLASSMGAGPWSQMLSFSPMAMMMATAGIIAQAMRMAYVFQETSARVAANLSVGTGAAGFTTAFGAVQSAATGQVAQRYGVGPSEAIHALATYQAAAGATLPQTLRDQDIVLASARAFGLTTGEAAGAIGGAVRLTGETGTAAARGIFGGAEAGGQLGRDIRSFMGATQAVLTQLAFGAPGRPISAGQAAAFAADVGRNGGIYATQQGVMTMASGFSAMTQGIPGDPMRLSLALQAGISLRDIQLGTDTPRNRALMMRELKRVGGGTWDNPITTGLIAQYGGQEFARMFYGAKNKDQIINDMMAGKNYTANDVHARAAAAMGTDYGKMAKTLVSIDQSMIKMGTWALNALNHLIQAGHLDTGLETVIKFMPAIFAGLAALNTVLGGAKLLGMLGRLGGAAALGEEGAAGIGLLGGSVAAMLGVAGVGGAIWGGAALEKRFPGIFGNADTRGESWDTQGMDAAGVPYSSYVGAAANPKVMAQAAKWGATPLMQQVLGRFQGFGAYPITSLKRASGDAGHQQGNAVDVGVPYTPAGEAYVRRAIASGLFQKIGTNPAWVAELRAYAQGLGRGDEYIFADPGTGPHAHLEISPAAYGSSAQRSILLSQQPTTPTAHTTHLTKRVKASDGSQHNVTMDITTYISPALLPTTSTSRTNSANPAGRLP